MADALNQNAAMKPSRESYEYHYHNHKARGMSKYSMGHTNKPPGLESPEPSHNSPSMENS